MFAIVTYDPFLESNSSSSVQLVTSNEHELHNEVQKSHFAILSRMHESFTVIIPEEQIIP